MDHAASVLLGPAGHDAAPAEDEPPPIPWRGAAWLRHTRRMDGRRYPWPLRITLVACATVIGSVCVWWSEGGGYRSWELTLALLVVVALGGATIARDHRRQSGRVAPAVDRGVTVHRGLRTAAGLGFLPSLLLAGAAYRSVHPELRAVAAMVAVNLVGAIVVLLVDERLEGTEFRRTSRA